MSEGQGETAHNSFETAFGDLDETPVPVQPSARPANTVAGTGNDPDVDLVARVVGLLANKSATDRNAISAFMRAVVPWPGSEQDPGYVNLHYDFVPGPNYKGPKGGGVPGWPYKTIDLFNQGAYYILNNAGRYRNAWFCTSLQSLKGVNKRGKDKAVRKAANALKLKAIWIDCDVKPDDDTGKHYTNPAAALKELLGFAMEVGLPTPSVIVHSGGGFHIYWCSQTDLTVDEWRPYAAGLKALLISNNIKCDTGLTTDCARLLRVPGTMNYKYDPPRPVRILTPDILSYDFSQLDFLKQHVGSQPLGAPPKTQHNIFADGVSLANFGKLDDAFADLKGEPNLDAGLAREEKLLDPLPIMQKCGFLKDALLHGGKDYNQPLWMLSVLCSTFMEDGNGIAHKISNQHPAYSETDTQAMFDRKLAERRDAGIGYPSCAAIAGSGSEACKKCPLQGKIKSPLNLRIPGAVEGAPEADDATVGPNASAPPELKVSFSNIPHRQWLYGVDLVRGEITLLASPGGAGKTSLALGITVCLATGREVLGEKVWGRDPFNSLYINAEDGREEMLRRSCAFCQQHGITEQELDRLHLIGADSMQVQRLKFLRTAGTNSSALDEVGFTHLDNLLTSLRPDLVVIDPLIALCGGGNINDNAVMSLVMRELKKLAIKYNCAVLIVLHTRKGGDLTTADAISGASAIKDLARRAIMPVTMTEVEAKAYSLLPSERFRYFRLVDAKSNLAPHANEAWYRLENQELPNAELPTYPHGDRVQAVARVALTPSKNSVAGPEKQRIRFELLKLIDRGLEINGETVPYSPNSTGKNKMRAILDEAMDAVTRVSEGQEYAPSDLRAVAERELEALKHDGWVVVEPIAKGRFRRCQGLRPVWERTPWAKEREALREHGGPTVRTEEEEDEWRRKNVEELLREDQQPNG